MSLFAEMKRRKVVQVAVAYAVVAWLLVQIAVNIEEPLSLPDWFDTATIALVSLGFPIAVILAWAFQVTPSGVKVTTTIEERTSVHGRSRSTSLRSTAQFAVTAVGAAAIGASALWFWIRDPDAHWIEEEVIPQIEERIEQGNWEAAYALGNEAHTASRGDAPLRQVLEELAERYSQVTTISSEPEGAAVYRRAYDSEESAWEELGETPLEDIRVPFGPSRLRFELEGYVPLERTIGQGSVWNKRLDLAPFQLDTEETLPPGKVRVPEWTVDIDGESTDFADFFLSKFEVTNEEYKRFVDAGGYTRPDLWPVPIVFEGREITFEDAMARLTDRTGRAGPKNWVGGDYPAGEGDYPVSGVSWYEAAAYAKFVGEELPTVHHWNRSTQNDASTWILPASNLASGQLRPVGESDALTWVGAYDLIGNAREWTANAQGDQRLIVGSSANDSQSLTLTEAAGPFDRSDINGFRTVRTQDDPVVSARARAPRPAPPPVEIPAPPVSDEVYAAYSRVFAYAPRALNVLIEGRDETRHWVRERITFDAAYGDERVPLYLYLPRTGGPPYQTVVYWPGIPAVYLDTIDDYPMVLDFVVKNGRAVAFPVYKGTFERRDRDRARFPGFTEPAYREYAIMAAKDLRRSVDYLESRADINESAIAYFGHSWGAQNGPTAIAQDGRFQTAVFYVGGGLYDGMDPEVDPVNALPRVTIPVLMLNGEFDWSVTESSKLFFDLISTPDDAKRHIIVPGGHYVEQEVLVRETLDWLDRWLGTVPSF